MPVLLILLVAAFVELTVLVVVGDAIGVLPTLALLLLASLAGMILLRREGTRTLAAFSEAVRTRRPPHREVIDGMLLAAAGVFIVLPGFVSDVIGLLLLLPPTRALVRRRMLRSAPGEAAGQFPRGQFPRGQFASGQSMPGQSVPGRFPPGTVIDGEVVDDEVADEPSAPRPGPAQR